jgi:transposase
MLDTEEIVSMIECKHGMKSGCSYCHAARPMAATTPVAPTPRKRGSSAGLSEKMNDRMTTLKKRLKAIRGD